MNKRNIKFQQGQYFPVQQLQKFMNQQNSCKKRLVAKNNAISKAVSKNHSKSLYYNSLSHNIKHNFGNFINRTANIIKPQNINQQTLNQQLLGGDRRKPMTTQFKSGRNTYLNMDTRNNKISLRSSSNYSKLISIAGVPVNELQSKSRMQNSLHTKINVRRTKLKELQKENQKIAKRLNSQQSEYSTKKLLKAYESQQKISKRLTDSKMSKRSNCDDQRSVYSQNSSRASVRSGQSRNSRTNSLKSTSRANSSKSSSRNQGGRFQARLKEGKKVKIIEHNIHKINQQQLNRFKNLFANSFSTTNNSGNKNKSQQKTNYQMRTNNEKILKSNPYAYIEILSQKSETSIKQEGRDIRNYVSSVSHSNRKLKQVSFDGNASQQERIIKKTSAITSINNDGLLHRIAQEMYNKNSSTDDLRKQLVKSKKQTQPVTKTANVLKNQTQKERDRSFLVSQQNRALRGIRTDFKYAVFPTNQIFAKV